MTYATDETSVEDSQPRDCIEFILPIVTYRLTSGVEDVVLNGQTYTAGTIKRSEPRIMPTGQSTSELEIEMLVSHYIPQRYLAGGVPPRRIDVNVYRYQKTSAQYELYWSGRVTSMSCKRHLAVFLVPARGDEVQKRRIPTITLGKECPHILFNANTCRANRAGFTVTRTVVSVNGPVIALDSAVNADATWSKYGEVTHVASGEKSTVQSQFNGLVIPGYPPSVTLHLPISDIKAGDTIQISAGCAHDIETCATKFQNKNNYGGAPHLPAQNPFLTDGYGVIVQV